MTTTDIATLLPPIPPGAPTVASEPPYSLGKIIAALVLVVATFDACFWRVGGMGFSVAVFVPVMAAAIVMNRERALARPTTLILCALLAGACCAVVVEASATNTLVLLILIVGLAGDSYFDREIAAWARWFSEVIALAFAPGRVFWLAARMLGLMLAGTGRFAGALGAVLLALPAVVLALVFGSLLASGNAVFGSWTSSFFNWFWDELAKLLDFDRILVWCIVAFFALPLLRPARVSAGWWSWIPRLPRLPELVPSRGAAFSSALVLIVLNLLFGVANFADAMFLWSGNSRLPAGVTYSGFVHDGVNTLTVTVLLSAVVLAGLFQQQLSVTGQRGLKVLGLLWIAQNLFVLISVVLRLKLYIEAYDMTVARLSVIIFLLLVAAGYGLLTIKIVREKSLPWLVGGCAVAIFATFYITQFLNLAGWTANYNVARWEQDRTRNLDFTYLTSLGPTAWPAMAHAAQQGAGLPMEDGVSYSQEAAKKLLSDIEATKESARFDGKHWREFSLRAWWNRGVLDGASEAKTNSR